MNSEISNVIDLNKRDLEKLSKAELIKMVKKLQKKAKKSKIVIVDDDYRPVPPPRTYKPIPAPSANETIKKPVPKPSKSVKQTVNEYEDLILPPPHRLGMNTNQFQFLGPTRQSRNPCINNARLSNKWLTSMKTSYYHHPHSLGVDTNQFQLPGPTK